MNAPRERYPDGRPVPTFRLPARDAGIIVRRGRGDDAFDALTIREAQITLHAGTYYLNYDAPGPRGWHTCLATSTDLRTWQKKGPVLEPGAPGEPDSACACSPWTIFDGTRWHLFYVGTPNASPPPERVPGFPYLTLHATGPSPAGPWTKQRGALPFTTRDGTYYSVTASPGCIIRHNGEYLMYFSATMPRPGGTGVLRTLGIARTRDLDSSWSIDPAPILPPAEQVENSSVYFEETTKTWYLFTNHIGLDEYEYTDAVWAYQSADPELWDPSRKAVALDRANCGTPIIGMPSVVRHGERLALLYDARGGEAMPSEMQSHMGRDIGLAWMDLPLSPIP
jgi:hypothetical protein